MSPERPSWAPASIDLDRPNAARIYDYFLGGACNFEQDREFAHKFLEIMPEAETAARRNRAFLRRAVRYCVDQGIHQFLDLGSGIPTVGNVHEIAQDVDPECRVLYVDNEPVAVAHSELMLADNDNAGVVQADLSNPQDIFDSAAAEQLIDFRQPMAVLIVSVLHFVPDDAQPYQAVSRYVEAMASGSLLVLSHGTSDSPLDRMEEAAEMYQQSSTPGFGRTHAEVSAFFEGTELVEPGLVWTPLWHPESPEDIGDRPERSLVYAGVGRKP